ncbi:glycosyltransferase family 4 protein [Nocardioides sp. NPDC000445]|uniref:glycosyltransferase family 4 protein n=1 Tax=Nocardioides sp. NPDC000445 TaxID=3154257 RepID=UPI0033280F24
MTMRPTRVCFLNPFGYELFDPATRASRVFGGAEVQLYYLATALAALEKFSVSMIVESANLRHQQVVEGVKMIPVRPEPPALARLRDRIPIPSLRYLSAMRTADADIYLQRGGAVQTGDVALHCRVARRRFVFMAAHDWDCDHHHRGGSQYLAGTYYVAGLHRADLVYAQSQFQQDQLQRHHHTSSAVQRTVYPAAPVSSPDEREHVLWVGRCVDWKRPMAFLDLAEARPDVPFMMACAPYEGAHDLYVSVAARADLMPNVEFLGFVPFAATDDLFRNARVIVNTSTVEGFPNTFVQAARVATPVLSLEVDPDRVLETGGFGACADGNPATLAEQLDQMLDNATWRRHSANALDYFRTTHDLETILPAFARSLEDLCRS